MKTASIKKSPTLRLPSTVNFGEGMTKRGITQMVNGLPE